MYEQVIFTDASSSSTIKEDLQAWTRSLGDGHEEDVWEDALKILAGDLHHGGWLMILDNADDPTLDLITFLPKCYKGTVLITSRNRDTGQLANTHHLELGEMERGEALSVLLRAARRQELQSPDEIENAQALIEKLGFLAVALVQAGCYCHQQSLTVSAERPYFTFRQYATLFSSQRTELMTKAEPSLLDNYKVGAYTAFEISYEAVPEYAKHFLQLVSFFHHGNIPLVAFETAVGLHFRDPRGFLPRPDDHTELLSDLERLLCIEERWNEIYAHEIIRKLRSFSLISASSISNVVFLHLHPLVQSWARDRSSSGQKQYQRMARQVVTVCCYDAAFRIHQHLLSHFDGLIIRNGEAHVNDKMAAGSVLKEFARYDDAEVVYNEALEILRVPVAHDNDATLDAMLSLASAYCEHGKWDAAEALQLEVIDRYKIRESPFIAIAKGRLATTYLHQSRFSEAKELLVQDLDYAISFRGKTHQNTLRAAGNLAAAYAGLGLLSEAEELILETLEQRKAVLGDEHPDTMSAVGTLADIYRSQGRINASEKLDHELLQQRRRLLGKQHPHTILTMATLAHTYNLMGEHHRSEELELEVLELRTRILGRGHPDTLRATSDLAQSYCEMGRYNEAERLELEVLEQSRNVLGVDHLNTILAMGNLATTYTSQGRFNDARKLWFEVWNRRYRVQGGRHPDTTTALLDLIICIILMPWEMGKSLFVKGFIKYPVTLWRVCAEYYRSYPASFFVTETG